MAQLVDHLFNDFWVKILYLGQILVTFEDK